MKRFTSIFISFVFVLGVFAPFAHVLFDGGHAHEVCLHESADSGVALYEHCGGAQNPCSRPDHDHHSEDAHGSDCLVCKFFKTAPWIESLSSTEFKTVYQFDQNLLQHKDIFLKQQASSFTSRAPPLFL